MTFHVGQQVVCINFNGWSETQRLSWEFPEPNVVYQIREFDTDDDGTSCLRLCEIQNHVGRSWATLKCCEAMFRVDRFRPFTDISIFKEMLASIPKETEPA